MKRIRDVRIVEDLTGSDWAEFGRSSYNGQFSVEGYRPFQANLQGRPPHPRDLTLPGPIGADLGAPKLQKLEKPIFSLAQIFGIWRCRWIGLSVQFSKRVALSGNFAPFGGQGAKSKTMGSTPIVSDPKLKPAKGYAIRNSRVKGSGQKMRKKWRKLNSAIFCKGGPKIGYF